MQPVKHVWTLLSSKGGAGKTTLACVLAGEIARRGKRVTLIDADPNKPLQTFASKGHLPDNVSVIVDDDPQGNTLLDNIEVARKNSDYVLIDTEGTANNRAMMAVQDSRFVIIPCQSSGLDMNEAARAVKFTQNCARIRREPLPFVIMRTRMPAAIVDRGEKLISGRLSKAGFPVCKVQMVDRPAYRAVTNYGMFLHQLTDEHTSSLKKARDEADAILRNVAGEYVGQVEVLSQRQSEAVQAEAAARAV